MNWNASAISRKALHSLQVDRILKVEILALSDEIGGITVKINLRSEKRDDFYRYYAIRH